MAIILGGDVGTRVALYDVNGNPILGSAAAIADNAALPTAMEVASVLQVLRRAGTTLDIVRDPGLLGTTINSGVTGIMSVAPYLWDDTSGKHSQLRGARGLAVGNVGDQLLTISNWLHNGSTWDQQHGNKSVTYLASAARVATPTVADITNYNGGGVIAWVNVTVSGGGGHGITITIDEKDPVSGVYKTVLTSAEIAATGLFRFVVKPGITVAANVSVADALSRTFRILPTHTDATSNTYSVGYDLV